MPVVINKEKEESIPVFHTEAPSTQQLTGPHRHILRKHLALKANSKYSKFIARRDRLTPRMRYFRSIISWLPFPFMQREITSEENLLQLDVQEGNNS